MKTFVNNLGKKVLIFAETFETEAMEQVIKMANFEAYQNETIRIMPDAHAGKGCTVGTTMTITDKVTPNLVGVDIGCGMLAIRLKEKFIDFAKLDEIIKNKVPSGFGVHQSPKSDFDFSELRCKNFVDIERAKLSIGSLGGGNHFIEVARLFKTGSLYLIIHSGSRKLGGDVCKYYQNLAYKSNSDNQRKINDLITQLKKDGREKEIKSEISKIKTSVIDKDLCYLTGENFDNYMNDMMITQGFASKNREEIANIIIREYGLNQLDKFETIHNYIDFNRMILRKGAVSAEKGERLLIPINMRDGSLLCIGKGNHEWNYSAPHGAGRLMSRSKAIKELSIVDFEKTMQGIYTTSVVESTLDEAPDAYKSISEITQAISDSVYIVGTLKPLYNFKAH